MTIDLITDSKASTTETVIVFGGSGFLGTSICEHFVERGFQVIIADKVIHADKFQHHKKISFYEIDVLDKNRLKNFFSLGNPSLNNAYIKGVVSLAGGACRNEFEGLIESSLESTSLSIDLNLKSHIFIAQLASRFMNSQASTDRFLTFVSSINALRSFGLPAYSAAKAGLIGLVRSSAEELGEIGIRINAVVPGTIPSPRTLGQPKDFEHLLSGTILNRFTTPAEIAKIVAALSIDFTCMTGQCITGDAGQTIKSIS